jgi:tetratricopeptide (TPR) repeat protein
MKWAGIVLLLHSAAWAQSSDEIARARTHYEAGRGLYNLGNYADAIREFSAGYALVPRPQFLVNLGQAYRKQGDLPRAREMFQKFLAKAPANDPDRPQIRALLDEIDDQLLEQPPPSRAQPSAQPWIAVSAVPPEKPKKSFMARHWWIIPVSAIVVTGVAVGLYFGLRPSPVSCQDASLGCLEAPPR